jgi:NADH-quinone oxidoreductase subunit L
MFRIYFVTFWGRHRGHGADHAHEAPAVMLIPLIILAVFSAVAGFVPMGRFVRIGEEHHAAIDLAIAIPASAVGLFGIGLAWFLYSADGRRAARCAAAMGAVYVTVKQKFYIDEVYLFVTRRILFRFVARPIAWFDRHVVDGGVNLSGWITRTTGAVLRHLQTGQVQVYGVWFVGGALMILLILWAGWR